MSKIVEYKALEAQVAAQIAQLDAMKASGALKREIEFEDSFVHSLRLRIFHCGMSLRYSTQTLTANRQSISKLIAVRSVFLSGTRIPTLAKSSKRKVVTIKFLKAGKRNTAMPLSRVGCSNLHASYAKSKRMGEPQSKLIRIVAPLLDQLINSERDSRFRRQLG